MKSVFLMVAITMMSACGDIHHKRLFNEIDEDSEANTAVIIHAPVEESYTCSEHWDGQFKHLGDALGTDCVVQEFFNVDGRMFMRSFKNEGLNNEDWFGFGKNVLAPCDCVVVGINKNDTVNQPGIMNPGRAGSVTFEKNDGTKILIAHIDELLVSEGDVVKRGAKIAKISNNGYSRNPHLHIAAWRGTQPLQIRFDQKTVGIKMRQKLNQ